MDTAKIIDDAAKKAGKPLPLDDYDREFGEGLLRSLNDTMDWVYGRKAHPRSKENFWDKLARWETEAEALDDE